MNFSLKRAIPTLAFVAFVSACGDNKTLSLAYSDSTAGKTDPDYVVYLSSDLTSNFTQAVAPAVDPTNNQSIYFYTSTPDNLKNCALFGGLVAFTSGYHSGTASEANCTSLASTLTKQPDGQSLFPIPEADIAESGKAVSIGSDSFVYAYFFYNSSVTNNPNSVVGTSVVANLVVPRGNRCFKLWAGRVSGGGQVSASDGSAVTAIDLKNLKCYGF